MLKEEKSYSIWQGIALLVLSCSLAAALLGLVFEWTGVLLLGIIGCALTSIPFAFLLIFEIWETNKRQVSFTKGTSSVDSELSKSIELNPDLPKYLPSWLDDLSDVEIGDYVHDTNMDENQDEKA